FRIKDAVLVFVIGAAGQPHRPCGGRNVPCLAAGQQLLGPDDLQKDFRQHLRVHKIKSALQLVHLSSTTVFTGNIIASALPHCKRADAILAVSTVFSRDAALLLPKVQYTKAPFGACRRGRTVRLGQHTVSVPRMRSEEHTSELQSRFDLVCRLLLAKKKNYT